MTKPKTCVSADTYSCIYANVKNACIHALFFWIKEKNIGEREREREREISPYCCRTALADTIEQIDVRNYP